MNSSSQQRNTCITAIRELDHHAGVGLVCHVSHCGHNDSP
jgi:hypothetical protein